MALSPSAASTPAGGPTKRRPAASTALANADLERAPGVEPQTGHEERGGVCGADLAYDVRGDHRRKDPQTSLGKGEGRLGRGDRDIGDGDEAGPAADGGALHAGQKRHG